MSTKIDINPGKFFENSLGFLENNFEKCKKIFENFKTSNSKFAKKVEKICKEIDNEKIEKLYLKIRNLIKKLKGNLKEIEKVSKEFNSIGRTILFVTKKIKEEEFREKGLIYKSERIFGKGKNCSKEIDKKMESIIPKIKSQQKETMLECRKFCETLEKMGKFIGSEKFQKCFSWKLNSLSF
jgi:hypothetical protein